MKNKVAYVILVICIGKSESTKFCYSILNDLKHNGVEYVLIFSVDDLPNFKKRKLELDIVEEKYPMSIKIWRYNRDTILTLYRFK